MSTDHISKQDLLLVLRHLQSVHLNKTLEAKEAEKHTPSEMLPKHVAYGIGATALIGTLITHLETGELEALIDDVKKLQVLKGSIYPPSGSSEYESEPEDISLN